MPPRGRWQNELVAPGYVVVTGICIVPLSERRANMNPERRAADAHAALAYARSLSYVDGRRVGIMGGSHGGSTTLAAMMARSSASI